MRVNNLIEKKNRREAERALKRNGEKSVMGASRFSQFSKQSRPSKFNGTKASNFNQHGKPKGNYAQKKAKLLSKLVDDTDDEQLMLQADKEHKEMEELFEIDQKYLNKIDEKEEDDIFAREARRQKDGVQSSFLPLRSPYID